MVAAYEGRQEFVFPLTADSHFSLSIFLLLDQILHGCSARCSLVLGVWSSVEVLQS